MVEIPDELVYAGTGEATVKNGELIISLGEVGDTPNGISEGEEYQVRLHESADGEASQGSGAEDTATGTDWTSTASDPPVTSGEYIDVEIESRGQQGDGVGKVAGGFVVIVPGASPGDHPTVRIEEVRENVAFAEIVANHP